MRPPRSGKRKARTSLKRFMLLALVAITGTYVYLFALQHKIFLSLVYFDDSSPLWGSHDSGSEVVFVAKRKGVVTHLRIDSEKAKSSEIANQTPIQVETDCDDHKSIHIVVSHCNKPLGWLWNDYFEEVNEDHHYSIKSVTIITKCGVPVEPEDLPPPEFLKPPSASCKDPSRAYNKPLVSVVKLSNVGRCDHTYAFWISKVLQNESNNGESEDDPFRMIAAEIDPTDLVLFAKDNNNNYRDSVEEDIPLLKMFNSFGKDVNATTIPEGKKAPFYPKGLACAATARVNRMRRHKEWTVWAHRSIVWGWHLDLYARELYSNNTTNATETLNTTEIHANVHNDTKLKEAFGLDNFLSVDRPMGSWIQNMGLMDSTSPEEKRVFSKEYMDSVVMRFDPTEKVPTAKNHGLKWSKEADYVTKGYRSKDISPMCYGGVFVTQWGQLSSKDAPVTPHGWSVISTALSRADNLEEGHYMERWWGDLLSWSSYSSSLGKTFEPIDQSNGSVLSESTVDKMMNEKFMHWMFPSPYTGLILLDRELPRDKKLRIRNRQQRLEAKKAKRNEAVEEM